MNSNLCDIFENLNYRLKYVFHLYKFQNVQNLFIQNFESFFILEKLKSVIFWFGLRFRYLNLRVTLSIVTSMTMRVADFWG